MYIYACTYIYTRIYIYIYTYIYIYLQRNLVPVKAAGRSLLNGLYPKAKAKAKGKAKAKTSAKPARSDAGDSVATGA